METVMTCATVVIAVATVLYVILTYRVIRKMNESNQLSRELERSRLRPIVVLFLEQGRDTNLYLRMRNFGITTAYDVRVELENGAMQAILAESKTKQQWLTGIPLVMLGPNQQVGYMFNYVKRWLEKSGKQGFSGSVVYQDGVHRTFKEPIQIDLALCREVSG